MSQDLEKAISELLHRDAELMFDASTRAPLLPIATPTFRRNRWIAPLLLAASVVAVAASGVWIRGSTVSADLGGLSAGTPSLSSSFSNPLCEEAESSPDSEASVSFEVLDDDRSLWTVFTVDGPDSRTICAHIEFADQAEIKTTAYADRTAVLQSAEIISIGDQAYIWGVVTPAASTISIVGESGTATGPQSNFYTMPTALKVFVITVPRADRYEVSAFDPNNQRMGEVLVD